jgi:Cu/Ag efflux protein CusF
MSTDVTRFLTAGAAILAASLAAGCTKQAATGAPPPSGQAAATPSKDSPAPARKPHTFRGKVEKIDPATKTLTVNGEDVEGWMGAMTMVYGVDKEDVLAKLEVGDQITATVYEGDFRTLYDVKVSPAKPPVK